jgi:hypothetical protein
LSPTKTPQSFARGERRAKPTEAVAAPHELGDKTRKYLARYPICNKYQLDSMNAVPARKDQRERRECDGRMFPAKIGSGA